MKYGDKVRERRLLKKLYEKIKYSYGAGVYYDEAKERFVSYSRNDRRLRNQTDRRIRRMGIDEKISNGKAYRKVYGYRWDML